MASASFVPTVRGRVFRAGGLIGSFAGLRFTPFEIFAQRRPEPHPTSSILHVAVGVAFVDHGLPLGGSGCARLDLRGAGELISTYMPARLPQPSLPPARFLGVNSGRLARPIRSNA